MTGSFRASPLSEEAWCSCSADIKPLAFRRAKTPCNWEECCAGQENRVAAEFSGIHENRTRRIAAAPAGGGIRGRRNAERQSESRQGALGAINNGMNPLEIAPCWPEAVLGVDMISAAAMGGYRARSARQKNIQRPLPPKVQQALYILLGEYRVNAGDGTRRLVLNRGQPPCYPF